MRTETERREKSEGAVADWGEDKWPVLPAVELPGDWRDNQNRRRGHEYSLLSEDNRHSIPINECTF